MFPADSSPAETKENVMNTLEQHIAFIKEAEGLKSVLRTSWSSAGRPESTAEHSWRLTLLAALFLKDFPTLDPRRTLLTALIHDLGELYDGDISAALLPDENVKLDMERKAVHRLFSLLPDEDRNFFLQLWEDYNAAATPEARLIKALDKAETIIQHNQGKNPPDFDYSFNLDYGVSWFQDSPLLRELRELLDAETGARVEKNHPA